MEATVDSLQAMQDVIDAIRVERLSLGSFTGTSSSSEDIQEMVNPLGGMQDVIDGIGVGKPSLVSSTK